MNDIFDEVTRQMGTLKRQAAKAERYGILRDELRTRLRVVLASRMQQMDAEQAEVLAQIGSLATQIDLQAAAVEQMDGEHTAGVRLGYELDQQIREAGGRANQSAVELERVTARIAANTDRVVELTGRIATGGEELVQAREQLAALAGELEQQRSFLEDATSEAAGSRQAVEAQQARAQEAVRSVAASEQAAEGSRRAAMQLMQRAAASRNEQAQAEAALGSMEREAERLGSESEGAKRELAELGVQRGQVAMSFGSVTERLKRLEEEIAEGRRKIEAARAEETATKRRGDQMRGERAGWRGGRARWKG